MSLAPTDRGRGVPRTPPARAPVTAADGWIVVAAAASLALFEGPASLRKLRSGIAGLPVDVTLLQGIASRVAWALALVPLLLVVWRLGARELAGRRGIAESLALHAEALPFVPFVMLLAGFSPGWGDTYQEPWSFAVLFLFLGTAVASAALRLAVWHIAFPDLASASRPWRAAALYVLAGLGWMALWRTGALVRVQPHWSTLADRSPYWPTRWYVALWSATALYVALPPLSIPALLLRAGKPNWARATALGIGGAAVLLGLEVASAHRAVWDDAFVRFRFDGDRAANVIADGSRISGLPMAVPGLRSWAWRPGSAAGADRPTRLRAQVRVAPVPQASLWYRSPNPIDVRVFAESNGARTDLAHWRLDPRTQPADRRIHSLETTLWVLPGRDLVISVETRALDPRKPYGALPVLAAVEVTPAGSS